MNSKIMARELAVGYGKHTVLQGMNFSLTSGNVYGLIGPNGAGKTTIMRTLAGQIKTLQGDITAEFIGLSYNPLFDNDIVMEKTILQGADCPLVESWSVKRIFKIASRRWVTWQQTRAEELIQRFGIDINKRCSALSRGQRTAVQVIIALATNCAITLLDEPSLGIDIERRGLLYEVIREEIMREERLFIISTHQLDESAPILDTLLIVRDGRLVAMREVSELNNSILTGIGPVATASEFLNHAKEYAVILRQEEFYGQLRFILAARNDTAVEQIWQLGAKYQIRLANTALEKAVIALMDNPTES